MDTSALSTIAKQIEQLSADEQLWLIERLAQHLRRNVRPPAGDLDAELSAMAVDPDIQRELRAIDNEFGPAETDGLEEM